MEHKCEYDPNWQMLRFWMLQAAYYFTIGPLDFRHHGERCLANAVGWASH